MGANISTVMVVVALAAGLWWGFARGRRPALLELFSVAALAVGGCHARGRGPALAACSVAGSRSGGRGCRRASTLAAGSLAPLAEGGRAGVLVVGLALGGLALLTALVPTLPKPSGPHSVGSVVFRWTDDKRSETFTADPSDRRQVVAQAWYPTDTTTGKAVPYFEAQGRLPSSIDGLAVLHVRLLRQRRDARDRCDAGQCRAANVAGVVLLAWVVGPARAVHGSLR